MTTHLVLAALAALTFAPTGAPQSDPVSPVQERHRNSVPVVLRDADGNFFFRGITENLVGQPAPAAARQDPVEGDSPVEGDTPQDGDAPETDGPTPRPIPKLPISKTPSDPYAALRPGILPPDTAPLARERFTALAPRDAQGVVLERALFAFDLGFELIARGEGPQRNEAKVQVRFAEPSYISFSLGQKKTMGFGPGGYWQVFPDDARYLNGRDYVVDRERIVEVRSVARNFLSLADARRLRVTRAWVPEAPPQGAPKPLVESTKPLIWLALESPDFDVAVTPQGDVAAKRPARLFRAHLGIDPAAGHVVREALVQELRTVALEDGSTRTELVSGTAMWVHLTDRMALGATSLPGTVHVHVETPALDGLVFEDKPRQELYLLRGELNPELPPATFTPPELGGE